MHHAILFHIQHFGLYMYMYFLPASNFAPFEEVKVLSVSNSDECFQKSAPWRILMDLVPI